jgi:hypothetical protein
VRRILPVVALCCILIFSTIPVALAQTTQPTITAECSSTGNEVRFLTSGFNLRDQNIVVDVYDAASQALVTSAYAGNYPGPVTDYISLPKGTYTAVASDQTRPGSSPQASVTFSMPGCKPPLPTSKDQCKNGDFKSYGFKNEGDCVSFVATKGKNT